MPAKTQPYDSTPAVTGGIPLIDFTREAESFPEAVISALCDVAKVTKQFPNLHVVRVEIPDPEFLDLINCALALPRVPWCFEKTLRAWLSELLRWVPCPHAEGGWACSPRER